MTNYSIRHATHQTDGEALLPLAIAAVDEAQGPYSTRRPGSELEASAFNSSVVFVAEDAREKRLVGFIALRVVDIADTAQSLAARRADVTMLGRASRTAKAGHRTRPDAARAARGKGARCDPDYPVRRGAQPKCDPAL